MKYQELQSSLNESGIPMKLEECHAIVCACACLNPNRDDFGQVCHYLTQAREWDIDENRLAFVLEALWPTVCRCLQDSEIDFQLMLPAEDDASAQVRAQALANWCSGFLIGLSVRTEANQLESEKLSEDSRGFLADLSRIADIDGESDIADNETSEKDLFDLIDYCRLGVIGVFIDLENFRRADGSYSPYTPKPKAIN